MTANLAHHNSVSVRVLVGVAMSDVRNRWTVQVREGREEEGARTYRGKMACELGRAR